jgi:hypothetical protein
MYENVDSIMKESVRIIKSENRLAVCVISI